MLEPIRKLSITQLRAILADTYLDRRITEIHLHHTWRPTRAQDRGQATVEAMRRVHVEEWGWSDIAQHLTIGADGGLWTGRPWNRPPASAKGHNGTSEAGPFMIEMIGDFDHGNDRLEGAQRNVAVGAVALLLQRFELTPEELRFHREFSPKSCPGTGLDHDALRAEVEGELERLKSAEPVSSTPFGSRYLDGFGITRSLTERERRARDDEGTELPEAEMSEAEIAFLVGASDAPTDTREMTAPTAAPLPSAAARGGEALDAAALKRLRGHVINLSMGQLSEHGTFGTTPEDLDAIFVEHLGEYLDERDQAGETPRILIFAHGGLVDEARGLAKAARDLDWFLANGIYPLFAVWETGWSEILVQQAFGARAAFGARGLFDGFGDAAADAADRLLEISTGPLAKRLWAGIKASAELAAQRDLGGGVSGGAYLLAHKLRELARERGDGGLELHALGHSAGAIFQAHLLEVITRQGGPKIESLHLLAPSSTVELFKQKTIGRLGEEIVHLTVYTMQKDFERADTVRGIYQKSLLYYISRACEPVRKTPILGLEESIRGDDDLRKLFGLHGNAHPKADVIWSKTPSDEGAHASTSITHGGFDEDRATLNAVMLRVLGQLDEKEPPVSHLGPTDVRAESFAPPVPAAPLPPPAAEIRPAPAVTIPTGGTKRALSVGIDRYADIPLGGCVADSRAWGGVLESLGFAVDYLHDEEATLDAISESLRRLVTSARSGDVVVFQYAGHGSQVPDDSGDEREDDFDEAFVPVDYQSSGFLIDDDLGAIYRELPPGVNLTLFMDCCHSGTNQRFAPAFQARGSGLERRYLPATAELVEIHRRHRAATRSARARPAGPEIGRENHFAACQDHEYAYEQNGQGDFTRHAAPHLAAAVTAGLGHRQFIDAVRARFGPRPRQHPRLLSKNADAPLLAPLEGPNGMAAGPNRALGEVLAELENLLGRLRGIV